MLAASSAPHCPYREVFDRVRVAPSEPGSFSLPVPGTCPRSISAALLGAESEGSDLLLDDRLLSLHSLPDLCHFHCADDSACLAITCSMVLASDGMHSVDQVCDRICQIPRQT